MKKLVMLVTMALAGALVAQDKSLSLADARGKIGDVVADPGAMTTVIKQLSATNQLSFLSEVNAAIDKMPGSPEEKAAKYLDVNSAALKGSQKGNLEALVAEVFATVPPAAQTVINEQFASTLFNRAADPSKTYTDARYTEIAQSLLDKVQERTATTDDAGVRNTFAILMLLRASNGTPADLRDTLVNSLKDPETRNLAQNEWISPALGIGQEKTYDPMLGASSDDDSREPNPEIVLNISFAQAKEALLADLTSGDGKLSDNASAMTASVYPLFADTYNGTDRKPRSLNPEDPFYSRGRRGQSWDREGSSGGHGSWEPHGYDGQTL